MAVPGSLLRDRVTFESYLGDTSAGPTWGDAVAADCRIETRSRLIRRPNGVEVTSTVTLFVNWPAVIAAEDRVYINSVRYEVVEVRVHRLAHRISHVEVLCA